MYWWPTPATVASPRGGGTCPCGAPAARAWDAHAADDWEAALLAAFVVSFGPRPPEEAVADLGALRSQRTLHTLHGCLHGGAAACAHDLGSLYVRLCGRVREAAFAPRDPVQGDAAALGRMALELGWVPAFPPSPPPSGVAIRLRASSLRIPPP